MKIKPLKQPDDTACGPTSIQMVSEYFDAGYTFPDVAKATKYIEKDGLGDLELVESLSALGFKVRHKINTTWSELMKANNENSVVIVSWMLNGYIGHFSVVDSVDKDSITIAEPEVGKLLTIEKIQFMRLWMGYDDMWYPIKNTDIQLRWMCVVKNKKKPKTT
jgi:ABC-type bacteriocin/lantibiotic exporter with double-glycine peptidase domain